MKPQSITILAALLLIGCNAAYREPQAVPAPVEITPAGTKAELFARAAQALVAEGFTIAMSDKDLGIISTQRREMVLGVKDVDLGTTMGINYVKDNRTTEYVTATIAVSDNKATIRTDIDGEYLPNDPVHGKRMKGVSLGTIEAKIAERLDPKK